MKKNISRIICMLLALLFVATCCIACAKKNNGADGTDSGNGDQNAVSTDPQSQGGLGGDNSKKTEAELPDVNYNGYKVQVLVRPTENCMLDITTDNYSAGDVEEVVFERTVYMKETFGIELELNRSSDANCDFDALEPIKAGDQTYDLLACHGRAATAYAIQGCAYDWNDLKWVDLECDWWTQAATDAYTVNGALYFMLGDISHMKEGQTICMYFNKGILDDARIDYPYDLALEGKWTLETMTRMARDAYASLEKTGTGLLEDDSFAYVTGWWRGPMQLLYSTGHRVIKGNSSSEFELDLYNDTTIEAYKSYLDDFVFSGICNNEAPGDYAKMQNAFKADRVVFYDDLMEVSYRFDDVDFGILPWPKYSEDVEGYPCTVGAYSNFFVVPSTVKDAEMMSVVLEAMSYYGYKNIISVYFDEVLSYKYSPDPESVEILNLIKESRIYDFGGVYNFGGIGDMGKALYEAGTGTEITTFYNSLSSVAKSKFEDWSNVK